MKDKHALTEKLKVIETEVFEARIDLSCINKKLEIAQQYEEDLLQRLAAAREKTKALRLDFFKKSGEISTKYDEMREICEVYTGNFYNHKL